MFLAKFWLYSSRKSQNENCWRQAVAHHDFGAVRGLSGAAARAGRYNCQADDDHSGQCDDTPRQGHCTCGAHAPKAGHHPVLPARLQP